MTIVYSVASRKGGVGKSSSSINLSSAFATMGLAGQNKRVLLIDLDPSGNATANCGINPETLSDKTTYQVVIGQQDIKDCIVHRDTFDLLPANSDLAASMTDFLIMYNQNGKQGEKILNKLISLFSSEDDSNSNSNKVSNSNSNKDNKKDDKKEEKKDSKKDSNSNKKKSNSNKNKKK